MSLDEVLAKLKALAKPDQLEGMARYGMAIERRLGVSIPDLRKLAKTMKYPFSIGSHQIETTDPRKYVPVPQVSM